MRIINLTSHSRRGLAKCNGGKLLIRRPGSSPGGIRRAFKSSGFFVFSEVRTLENPTIPLLLYLFQIKEIPAVLLTFTFSCQVVVRTGTWSRPFQYRSISKGCHTHVPRQKLSAAGVKESNSSGSDPQALLSVFLLLPLLLMHLFFFFFPFFTLFIISPLRCLPQRDSCRTHYIIVCVFWGFARKDF